MRFLNIYHIASKIILIKQQQYIDIVSFFSIIDI